MPARVSRAPRRAARARELLAQLVGLLAVGPPREDRVLQSPLARLPVQVGDRAEVLEAYACGLYLFVVARGLLCLGEALAEDLIQGGEPALLDPLADDRVEVALRPASPTDP